MQWNVFKIHIPFLLLFFVFSSCKIGEENREPALCTDKKSSDYVLPYPVGKTYTCLQGYVGRTYHRGVFYYGVDFNMSIGSVVTAARGGRIVFVEERFNDGDFGFGKENLVAVAHSDSTFGRYIHLTKDGALVVVGQIVAPGDTIGLSGNTGLSRAPHLHFDVTEGGPYSDCQTIPVCFKNTRWHPDGLVTGVAYTAEPY